MIWWNIIIGVASFFLNLVLMPKPQNAKPASLEDFNIPVAEEGLEIPVLFGTHHIKSPNCVWYGDLFIQPKMGPRRYGFFGPRSVTGHRYALGFHFVLGHACHDEIKEIWVGEKKINIDQPGGIAVGSTNFFVYEPNIWGGDDQEGGLWGWVTIRTGSPGQAAVPYLVNKMGAGANTPAFRGVISVVLEQMYVGNSPYLKYWEFVVQRIHRTSRNQVQWYDAKAGIPEGEVDEKLALYFALDASISGAFGLFYTRLTVKGALAKLETDGTDVDIHMVAFGATVQASIEKRGADAADYDALEAWLDGLTGDDTNPNFNAAVSQASAFFGGSGSRTRRLLILTDGGDGTASDATVSTANATIATIGGVQVFGFCFAQSILASNNLDAMDTTPADNQPVTGHCPIYYNSTNALFSALGVGSMDVVFDMNPAHIIRECLTDRTWGMGYATADIDDTSFMNAADTLYIEKFGMSLQWTKEEEIQEFISMILAHIDGYLYLRRSTGKFYLKLIRKDYVVASLPMFDEDDVMRWDEVIRRSPAEAINSVTVRYTDRHKRGLDASTTYDAIGQIQQLGARVSATRHYPGISRASLASRAAKRDQLGLGVGMISGRLTGTRAMDVLYPGDPFRLVSSRHNLDGEVMRAVELKFGDGRTNSVGVKFVQDVFNMGLEEVVDSSDGDWESPVNPPEPVAPRLVWELPYREMRELNGEANAISFLNFNPDVGMVGASGGRPTQDSTSADLQIDGAFVDSMSFSPSGLLLANIGALDATMDLTDATDEESMTSGMYAVIQSPSQDSETLEVVRITSVLGITIGIERGMLDTVPRAHSANDWIVFYSDALVTDFSQRSAGASPSVELLTHSSMGVLTSASAPDDVVDLDSRAVRPLRPANILIEGSTANPADGVGSDVTVSWAVRNRFSDGTAPRAWTAASDTPEAGQTTVIEVWNAADTTLLTSHTGLTGTSFNVPVASFDGELTAVLRVGSERDGYREWQSYRVTVILAGGGKSLVPSVHVDADVIYTPAIAVGARNLAPVRHIDTDVYYTHVITA